MVIVTVLMKFLNILCNTHNTAYNIIFLAYKIYKMFLQVFVYFHEQLYICMYTITVHSIYKNCE